MEQAKRKLNLGKSSNVSRKKLRKTNNDEKYSISISCLEDMSNEVFYEIFDYLDGYNIYKTFSNLNIRFQHLINSSSLLFKISLDETLSSEIRNDCKEVINHNKQHILSLRLCNSLFIDEFFTECIIYSSFDRLESLSLFQISPIKLMTILIYLVDSLPHLFSLCIDLQNGYINHFNEIYRMILHLPSLKYNKLSVLPKTRLNICIPFTKNDRFSTLEYLVMSHICDLNELASVLHYTPRLKRFKCQSLAESNQFIENKISITLSSLTHISIDDCEVMFVKFENFIAQICSQLQVLRINSFRNMNFIHPQWWKRLILQHMPHLFVFTLTCNMHIIDNFGQSHFETSMDPYTSPFWIERGWSFWLKAKPEKIVYKIFLDRKSSYKSGENSVFITYHNSSRQTFNKSNYQLISPVELCISNYSTTKWSYSFIDKITPVINAIHFKSLYLFWSGMSIPSFVRLLLLLPNLDSLKVSSSLDLQTSNLSIEEVENLRLLSISNNIKNVWQWMDFEQLKLFINLCPRVENFEVNGVKDIDIEKLVRFITIKTTTHIRHLYSLRLCVYNANDTMINKLQCIIDSEKLLSNYIIKRLDNVISLKWNLE